MEKHSKASGNILEGSAFTKKLFAERGTHRLIIWLYDSMDLQHSTFDFHANVIIHKDSKVQLA